MRLLEITKAFNYFDAMENSVFLPATIQTFPINASKVLAVKLATISFSELSTFHAYRMRLNILLIIHVLLRAVLTSKEFKKSAEIAKLTYGD